LEDKREGKLLKGDKVLEVYGRAAVFKREWRKGRVMCAPNNTCLGGELYRGSRNWTRSRRLSFGRMGGEKKSR